MTCRAFASLFWVSILCLGAHAAEEPKDAAKVAPALPSVEDAIPAILKNTAPPRHLVFPGGIRMAISTFSPTVQAHVNQGLNHLHGGWEFEASRHFAIAMRQDPDCLMAHWGMVLALLTPNPETDAARTAAAERLLHLVENARGTDLERGYAYGLVKYISEGPAGATEAFRRVSNKFPREMQAAILSALFQRGGYDEFGSPTADQEAAEERLLDLIEKFPESTAPLHTLLIIRAEAPDLTGSLALARKLSGMVPEYPPYQHLLGHYEWRVGNHREASAAFAKASTLYRNWMNTDKIDLADCPEWVRSESYRVISLLSQGEEATALASAAELSTTPLPETRPKSAGAHALWWDAKTLRARIGIHLSHADSLNAAMESLPSADAGRIAREHTHANWWIDGLRIYIEAKRLLAQGKLDEARNAAQALTIHGESMARTQNDASANGERSSWLRAFRALEVLASELRGEIALAGPADRRETAYNWFSSAADRQLAEPMLMPPMVLTPMAARLGHFHLKSGRPAEAVEAFERALSRFPKDRTTTRDLQLARTEVDKAKGTQTPGDNATPK